MVQSPGLLAPLSTSTPSAFLPSPSPYALTHETPSASFLIEETIRARCSCNYIEAPSLITVQTSFFLFSALFCLGKDNSAWFYLREAITFLQLLDLHEEDTFASSLQNDPILSTYSRRMFWVLFITERAYAIQRHRAPTLEKTIALPYEGTEVEKEILPGFFALIALFEPFDNDFFALWNHSVVLPTLPAELLVRMQRILMYTLPTTSGCTDSQLADLLISREWLKIMIWQLCVSNTMLSSLSNEESMSFRYPITIAREVILVSKLVPLKALEANGVGILEKVFDIGCSLADVLSLKPIFSEPSMLEVGPRNYLSEIIRIVGTTLGGSDKHLQILLRKASECLPTVVDRPLSATEDNSSERYQVYELEDNADD
ncbi:hypothetical protein TruAng_004850 [Truncatella angustata]|nr:hypothetical protein TruAng_004850 [Truncatella angustata]